MGKGDKKTKKGKIFAGSYGNSRKRKEAIKNVVAKPKAKKTTEAKTEEPKKVSVVKKSATTKKAPAKKVVEKK